MPFPEHLPILRIPRIVERFHPLQVLVSAPASPHFNSRRRCAPHPAPATTRMASVIDRTLHPIALKAFRSSQA